MKDELHKATGLLLADRVLYSAVHNPASYGFIPQTYSTDGDPLDVLVMSQVPLAPLSIARCRAIGAIRTVDQHGGKDDKILAVHIDDPQYAHYRDVSELPPDTMAAVKRFVVDSKGQKEVNVGRIVGHAEAERSVEKALGIYEEKKTEPTRPARPA